MDCVQNVKMAISMARQGGIGIIHKNMSIEEQALGKLSRVKRSESGVIVDPSFLLTKDHTNFRNTDNIMGKYQKYKESER